MCNFLHCIGKREKDEKRTHRCHPETHVVINPSWRPEEYGNGDLAKVASTCGDQGVTSMVFFAARVPSGDDTGSGTKLRMTAASTRDARG